MGGLLGLGCLAGEVISPLAEPAAVTGGRATIGFRPDVQAALEEAGCPRCHADGAVPMQVVPSPASEEAWQANYAAVSSRASLLTAKATGGLGHETIVSADHRAIAVIGDWAAHGAPIMPGAPPPMPAPEPDGGGDDPVSGDLVFRPRIQADLQELGCTGAADCHGVPGIPMTILHGPTTEEAWRANYEEVRARGGSSSSSLLLAKPVGVGGHPVVVRPDSPVLARWRRWIAWGMPEQSPAP